MSIPDFNCGQFDNEAVFMDARQRIIELVKPHISLKMLRELLILLEEHDTEAKRNILEFARKNP